MIIFDKTSRSDHCQFIKKRKFSLFIIIIDTSFNKGLLISSFDGPKYIYNGFFGT
jgi:hypothetical protein